MISNKIDDDGDVTTIDDNFNKQKKKKLKTLNKKEYDYKEHHSTNNEDDDDTTTQTWILDLIQGLLQKEKKKNLNVMSQLKIDQNYDYKEKASFMKKIKK